MQISLPNEGFLKPPNWEELILSLTLSPLPTPTFPPFPISPFLPPCPPKGISVSLGVHIIPSTAALCLPVYLTDLKMFQLFSTLIAEKYVVTAIQTASQRDLRLF